MSSFKSYIGETSGVQRLPIAPERIEAFCGAIHAKNRGEAPPTFLTIARDGEFGMLKKLGVPLQNLLHVDQEYTYEGSLYAGDELIYETSLAQVLEKKSANGSMTFFIFETQFRARRDQHERKVGVAKTNLLARG